jgi:hypothetical protein
VTGLQKHRDTGLPEFVKDEFEAFLECGILANGLLRARCAECAHEKLVAFSCKRRGFCPSCGARRMAESAAYLVDQVIPHVPVRQWVLSFPVALRILFAAQPELLTPVLRIVHAGPGDTVAHGEKGVLNLPSAGLPAGRHLVCPRFPFLQSRNLAPRLTADLRVDSRKIHEIIPQNHERLSGL